MKGKNSSPALKDVLNPLISFHAFGGGCGLNSRGFLGQIESEEKHIGYNFECYFRCVFILKHCVNVKVNRHGFEILLLSSPISVVFYMDLTFIILHVVNIN